MKKAYRPLTAFTFGELDEKPYKKLKACPYCVPTPRKAFMSRGSWLPVRD